MSVLLRKSRMESQKVMQYALHSRDSLVKLLFVGHDSNCATVVSVSKVHTVLSTQPFNPGQCLIVAAAF